MPDVMLWLTKPSEESVPDLEDVGEKVRQLDYVSEVAVGPEAKTVHISFEGGKAEQEEVEHTIQEAGYEIFKASHRG